MVESSQVHDEEEPTYPSREGADPRLPCEPSALCEDHHGPRSSLRVRGHGVSGSHARPLFFGSGAPTADPMVLHGLQSMGVNEITMASPTRRLDRAIEPFKPPPGLFLEDGNHSESSSAPESVRFYL